MELATPMFQIHFLPVVIKVLRSICKNCSKLLIDKVRMVKKISEFLEERLSRKVGSFSDLVPFPNDNFE
jgi:DNA-directed RNA polymerase beta' subunit